MSRRGQRCETCPSLSPDGRFLFLSRYNEPGDISDIYWISSEVVRQQTAPPHPPALPRNG